MFLLYGGMNLEFKVMPMLAFNLIKTCSWCMELKTCSGYVFTQNGGAVSWKSSKQETTANSTTEVEYIAASEAAKKTV